MDVAELLATASVYHDALAVGDPNAETLAADLGADFEMRSSRRCGVPLGHHALRPEFVYYAIDAAGASVPVKMSPEEMATERRRARLYNEWMHKPRWFDSKLITFDSVLRKHYNDERLRQSAESDGISVRLTTYMTSQPVWGAKIAIE